MIFAFTVRSFFKRCVSTSSSLSSALSDDISCISSCQFGFNKRKNTCSKPSVWSLNKYRWCAHQKVITEIRFSIKTLLVSSQLIDRSISHCQNCYFLQLPFKFVIYKWLFKLSSRYSKSASLFSSSSDSDHNFLMRQPFCVVIHLRKLLFKSKILCRLINQTSFCSRFSKTSSLTCCCYLLLSLLFDCLILMTLLTWRLLWLLAIQWG